jgi:hypothetical protein
MVIEAIIFTIAYCTYVKIRTAYKENKERLRLIERKNEQYIKENAKAIVNDWIERNKEE